MNWVQIIAIIFSNIAWCATMFLWLRKEANADRKELAASISNLNEKSSRDSREFHGRLCIVEEKIKRISDV